MNDYQSIPTSISQPETDPINYPPFIIQQGWIWSLRRVIRVFTEPFKRISRWKVVPLGTLSTTVSSQSWELGEFSLNWQGADAPQSSLRIVHQGDPSTVLWSTSPGHSFVSGAYTRLVIAEERGSIEISERNKVHFPHQTVDKIEQKGETLVIQGYLSKAESKDRISEYRLTFSLAEEQTLAFDVAIAGDTVNQAQLQFLTSPDEHFYGFGQQFSYLDCKGQEVAIICEEGGIGRGDPGPKILKVLGVEGGMFSSYAPSPHFITNHGRSLFLTNTEPSVFNLRDPNYVSIWVMASRLQGRMLWSNTLLEVIERYTKIVGRMPALPEWVHTGAIAGMQGGTEKVRAVWAKLRQFNTPIAGCWLQDWVGQRRTQIGKQLWWNWQLAEQHYPGWDDLVADMARAGIAVGTYINPFLIDLEKLSTEQQKFFKGKRRFFKEAEELGFLLKDYDQKTYLVKNTDFSAGLLDLSNPKACQWFKSIIKEEMLGTGIKFWMADFAEAAQFDAAFFSGESGLSYHNQYPVDWAALNREVLQETGRDGDLWFFTRAGFLKTPGYTTGMWLGDQNTTWNQNDGLPSALRGLISGGFSGFSLNHSDIGGYTSVAIPFLEAIGQGFRRSKELLFRWMEMNAFTTIFRTHEGNEPEKNVQFYTDDETLSTFSYWAQIYVALGDYRRQLVQESSSKGYPVVRHPLLHYPNDPNVYQLEAHFLLGSEFLIRPVMKQGQKQARVYLPAGEWVHLWSGQIVGNLNLGLIKIVAAPLGQPAVFYRRGSIAGEALYHDLKEKDLLSGAPINSY
jgi:alpha-glucosidase (family GH31 glycosyl hydrolase)